MPNTRPTPKCPFCLAESADHSQAKFKYGSLWHGRIVFTCGYDYSLDLATGDRTVHVKCPQQPD